MSKFVVQEKQFAEFEYPDVFKKQLQEETRNQWLELLLHGSFLNNIEKVTTQKTWQWLKGEHLKKEAEAMVCGAQEQILQLNSIIHHIGDQDVSPICRLRVESNETVLQLISSCKFEIIYIG